MNKEVVSSYPIRCIGIPQSDTKLKIDLLSSVDVSLTIYKDGKRDVGCSFLLSPSENCNRFVMNRNYVRCKHLFP